MFKKIQGRELTYTPSSGRGSYTNYDVSDGTKIKSRSARPEILDIEHQIQTEPLRYGSAYVVGSSRGRHR